MKLTSLQELVEISATIADKIHDTCSACFAGTIKGEWGLEHGCCGGCAAAAGYLPGHFPPQWVEYLQKKFRFTKTKGFLGKTGCKLPRELRSPICLRFHCNTARVAAGPQLFDLLKKADAYYAPMTPREFEDVLAQERKFYAQRASERHSTSPT